MARDKVIFQDEQGRGWLAEIEYGHPVPTERGIYAARFTCPEAPEEPARVGYLFMSTVEEENEEELREALSDSEPAREIR